MEDIHKPVPGRSRWRVRFPRKVNKVQLEPAGCSMWLGACGAVSADPQEQGEDGLECAEHQEWLGEW